MFGGVRSDLLLGGPGNDIIYGGMGHDVLAGGDHDDVLFGQNGNDILIGGFGADALFGDAGDDLLVGGWTAFDASLLPLAALRAEWSSGRPYEQRVANLRGTGGPRLNGDYFLVIGANATVFDYCAADLLAGGAGRNWFFANLGAGVFDLLTDRANNEFVVPVGP